MPAFETATLPAPTLQTYADTPSVTSAVLKAISELTLNKGQRIVFGPSSANGILLFREASQLLAAYGNRILGYMPVRHSPGQRV